MPEKQGFKRNLIIITLILAVISAGVLIDSSVSAKNITSKKQIGIINKNFNQAEDVLSEIDRYQAQYFTIIKRNDVFLKFEDSNELNKDRKELKKLFSEVKKQITNKDYLKEYKQIEKRYSKCEEETTIGINEFAQNYYNETDALLNKVYNEVKLKILPEDFKNLIISEKKWLKDVKDYEKVYNSMGFGTIGASVYYDYETNMRKFRTLLLMLYL